MIAYLIWSNEHRAWWGPDGRGYTPLIEEAGRYTLDDARRIVDKATLNGQLTHRTIGALDGADRSVHSEHLVVAPEHAANPTTANAPAMTPAQHYALAADLVGIDVDMPTDHDIAAAQAHALLAIAGGIGSLIASESGQVDGHTWSRNITAWATALGLAPTPAPEG